MRNEPARSSVALLVASVLSFAFAAPASAEIYKWTDARGGVHYSDKRPADNRAAERVQENQLSVVALLKPSVEEVRALNDRLLNRRIQRLEDELSARRSGPSVAYTSTPESSGVYYPAGGGFYGSTEPPLGEVIIDRDLDANGRSRNTSIQFIPRYEVRPGPYGVGAQAVPSPRGERRRLETRRLP